MARRSYPTDLSDTEWLLITPYTPSVKSGGRPAQHDRPEIVNVIRYVPRTA